MDPELLKAESLYQTPGLDAFLRNIVPRGHNAKIISIKLYLSFEYRQACLTRRGNSGSSTASELVAVDLLENVVFIPNTQERSEHCLLSGKPFMSS